MILNNDFKTIEVQSKDSNRLFVTLESIEENTNKMAQEILNVPPDFVMILDEVRFHDHVDAQSNILLEGVARELLQSSVYHFQV